MSLGLSKVGPSNAAWGFLAAFALYAIAACALFYHPDLIAGQSLLGVGGDAALYIWMFYELPVALSHFLNPLLLKMAWAPGGLNVTEATTTPALAFLAWPITAMVGPVIAFNIVSLLTPAFASICCFAFARMYTRIWILAFCCGWLYGFSTAVFVPLLGHLQTDFIAFIPLAFLIVVQYARKKVTRAQCYFWLTAVLVAQFFTSLETFVTEAIFLFLFALVICLVEPGSGRIKRIGFDNPIAALGMVYVLVGIIASPFIFSFFRDYAVIPHVLQRGDVYSLDLADFVVPTSLTAIGGGLRGIVMPHDPQYQPENLGYIGLPLAVLAIMAAWGLRREKRAYPLLAVLMIGILFCLGPRLLILKHQTLALPWALMEKLPFLQNALPSRLMPFPLLAMAGLCALWIEHLRRYQRGAVAVLAGAAVLNLPATLAHPTLWDAKLPAEHLFSSSEYRSVIKPGDIVLFLPFGATNDRALLWQVQAHNYFRIANGYGNFVPPALERWPAIRMLEIGAPGPDFSRQFNLFARANPINDVVVPQSILPIWKSALEDAGWAPAAQGSLTIFKPKDGQKINIPLVSSDEANYLFGTSHFQMLVNAAICISDKRHNQKPMRLNIAVALQEGCLSAAAGQAAGDPNSNWDGYGGWLGDFPGGIGIGVIADPASAKRLIARTEDRAESVYFPFPEPFRVGSKQAKPALLLEIFTQGRLPGKQ